MAAAGVSAGLGWWRQQVHLLEPEDLTGGTVETDGSTPPSS